MLVILTINMGVLLKVSVIIVLLIFSVNAFSQIKSFTTGNNTTFIVSNLKSITLHASSDGAAAYQWSQNGILITGAVLNDIQVTNNGVYTVTAFNDEGCPSPQSDTATVFFSPKNSPPPVSDSVDLMTTISSDNVKAILGANYNYTIKAINNSSVTGSDVNIKYSIPNSITYLPQNPDYGTIFYNDTTRMLTWHIDSLIKNSSIALYVPVRVDQPGLITSKVIISGSQPDPDPLNNTAITEQQVGSLMVPNVFTPNGDGVNEAFVIPGLENFSENELHIMNRWGSEIYVRKNYKNDWTGQGLVEGTYFYVLKIKSASGNWEINRGYLTLLRSKL